MIFQRVSTSNVSKGNSFILSCGPSGVILDVIFIILESGYC
jgi:hypothetical protein